MDTVRVDPAALSAAAAELTRLAGAVRNSRLGADGQVQTLSGRTGKVAQSVQEQWRNAGQALDLVEGDFREIGRALNELAAFFGELDRRAVGR